jgi:phage shock protein C
MFCTQCGAQISESAGYCSSCGKAIAAPANPASPAVTQTADFSAAPHRRLRRIISDKKVAGVCAGFAEYFDMDVTLMRIVWVALLLLPPGIGGIAYIVAWAVLPDH